MSGRIAAATVLAVVAFAWLPTSAYAQTKPELPLELEWNAPSECPSRDDVRREVARMALTGATGETLRRVDAHAKVTKLASGAWHVRVETLVEGTKGVRAFDAETCAAAADGAALMLAIAVNPLASMAEIEPPKPEPKPAPVPTPDPSASPPIAEEPPPSPSGRRLTAQPLVSLGAALAADFGTLPSSALGVQISLGVSPGPLRVELVGGVWSPQNATSSLFPRDGAHFRLMTLGARLGYALRAGVFQFVPYVGASVARLSADGFGGTATFEQHATWIAPLVGFALEASFARFLSVRLTAEAQVPTARSSFVVVDQGPGGSPGGAAASSIHDVGSVVGVGSLGFVLRIP